MNLDDARNIHIKLRKKYNVDELTPTQLQQIIDVILEYIGEQGA